MAPPVLRSCAQQTAAFMLSTINTYIEHLNEYAMKRDFTPGHHGWGWMKYSAKDNTGACPLLCCTLDPSQIMRKLPRWHTMCGWLGETRLHGTVAAEELLTWRVQMMTPEESRHQPWKADSLLMMFSGAFTINLLFTGKTRDRMNGERTKTIKNLSIYIMLTKWTSTSISQGLAVVVGPSGKSGLGCWWVGMVRMPFFVYLGDKKTQSSTIPKFQAKCAKHPQIVLFWVSKQTRVRGYFWNLFFPCHIKGQAMKKGENSLHHVAESPD